MLETAEEEGGVESKGGHTLVGHVHVHARTHLQTSCEQCQMGVSVAGDKCGFEGSYGGWGVGV